MPVRFGKSQYCSYLLPSWYLALHPDRNVILATYGTEFSADFGRSIRKKLADYGPMMTGAKLSGKQTDAHFEMAEGGQFRATSPRTSPSGKGAALIIADDLVRDNNEARSPTQRDKLFKWFGSELMTRLTPDGKVLVVMSRRHPDDLTGRLLAQNAELSFEDQWHTIQMPALNDDNESLCPAMYTTEQLLKIKRGYEIAGESYVWSCLYQQDPRGDESSFEWPTSYFTKLYEAQSRPKRLRVLILDPSKGSNSRKGDYGAFADMTLDEAGHYYVRPTLVRRPPNVLEDMFVDFCEQNEYDACLIEVNGFQELMADNIVRKAHERGVRCPLHKWVSTENKVVRIRMDLSPLLAQGRLHLTVQDKVTENQFREFPSAAHDDGIDAISLGKRLIDYLQGA